jgi:hypothetical protein
LLHECGDVSAVSLGVLGELVRRGAAFLEGLADGHLDLLWRGA